jgi:branched-subunit amino acid transport protein
MSITWMSVIIAALGCYLLKFSGVALPERVLNQPYVQRTAGFLPVTMLSALVTVQLVSHGGRYAIDPPLLAGALVAAVALVLRRGLFVVFVAAVAVTALLRM